MNAQKKQPFTIQMQTTQDRTHLTSGILLLFKHFPKHGFEFLWSQTNRFAAIHTRLSANKASRYAYH